MASEETDTTPITPRRKITVPLINAPNRTLGRPRSKMKFKKKMHGSCTNLMVENDQGRPDSGYDSSIIGQDLSGGASAAMLENLSLCSTNSDEVNVEKYRQDGKLKIEELIRTEKKYVEDLKAIDSFYNYMQESKIKPTPVGIAPMPDGLSNGKDRIVFANSRDILDFHQRCVPCNYLHTYLCRN